MPTFHPSTLLLQWLLMAVALIVIIFMNSAPLMLLPQRKTVKSQLVISLFEAQISRDWLFFSSSMNQKQLLSPTTQWYVRPIFFLRHLLKAREWKITRTSAMLVDDGLEILTWALLFVSFAFVMASRLATIGKLSVSFMPMHMLVLMSARHASTVCEASQTKLNQQKMGTTSKTVLCIGRIFTEQLRSSPIVIELMTSVSSSPLWITCMDKLQIDRVVAETVMIRGRVRSLLKMRLLPEGETLMVLLGSSFFVMPRKVYSPYTWLRCTLISFTLGSEFMYLQILNQPAKSFSSRGRFSLRYSTLLLLMNSMAMMDTPDPLLSADSRCTITKPSLSKLLMLIDSDWGIQNSKRVFSERDYFFMILRGVVQLAQRVLEQSQRVDLQTKKVGVMMPATSITEVVNLRLAVLSVSLAQCLKLNQANLELPSMGMKLQTCSFISTGQLYLRAEYLKEKEADLDEVFAWMQKPVRVWLENSSMSLRVMRSSESFMYSSWQLLMRLLLTFVFISLSLQNSKPSSPENTEILKENSSSSFRLGMAAWQAFVDEDYMYSQMCSLSSTSWIASGIASQVMRQDVSPWPTSRMATLIDFMRLFLRKTPSPSSQRLTLVKSQLEEEGSTQNPYLPKILAFSKGIRVVLGLRCILISSKATPSSSRWKSWSFSSPKVKLKSSPGLRCSRSLHLPRRLQVQSSSQEISTKMLTSSLRKYLGMKQESNWVQLQLSRICSVPWIVTVKLTFCHRSRSDSFKSRKRYFLSSPFKWMSWKDMPRFSLNPLPMMGLSISPTSSWGTGLAGSLAGLLLFC